VLHVAIHTVAVGPVALYGDEREALLADQALADARAPLVVLGGTVRRLAQQHVARVADALQQRVEVGGAVQRPREGAEALG
jgi:hypothetical protein